MLTNYLIKFQEMIMVLFNKEGIFIHCVMCVGFFAIATILALMGMKSGALKDLEDAKYQVLEEGV